jgi:hypothetical protein
MEHQAVDELAHDPTTKHVPLNKSSPEVIQMSWINAKGFLVWAKVGEITFTADFQEKIVIPLLEQLSGRRC